MGVAWSYGSPAIRPASTLLTAIDTIAGPQTAVIPASQLTELQPALCLRQSAEAHFNDEQTATLTNSMTYLEG